MVASVARWEEHLRMLKVLERECLHFGAEIEHLSENQALLATLMSKKCLQKNDPERFQEQIFKELKELKELEEQKSKKKKMKAVGSQAPVVKIGKGKGSSQDFTAMGAFRGRKRFCCGHRHFLLLFLFALWRMTWMKQCSCPPGRLSLW